MASYEKSNSTGISPKITFYTNHLCPYAHRAHIALKELDLPYDEVIIDLATPREPWYLKINPRGLVPTIQFDNGVIKDEIITESGIVTQFLADIRPSHLLPSSNGSPTAALQRARINFFVDAWNTKISPLMFPVFGLNTMEEKEVKCKEWAQAIEKEIEPLLHDANPFFGGSQQLTYAEVQVAPFLIRFYTLADGTVLPNSFRTALDALPNFSKWAKATMAKESVTYVFDEDTIRKTTIKRIADMKAKQK